ncbi:DUF1616 domain-containing protein [Natronomonas salsuginis]|uniref:DUF1616 domain-containing protein n=1 Tax=Natronomonas salsuginis TaxID=2217661 RepID=A0A4V5ZNM4_9EURY|nr:DUF1616 domain-containing protein [Natronomonas salsuginis]TKR25473.1 DUF1616 domain-containing protein [Natronomonas salsuginis]
MGDDTGRDRSLRLLLPSQIRTLPADLAAVLILVLATNLAVLLPFVNRTPLRIAFGLPFLLFLPGYAFIAALFPEQGSAPGHSGEDTERAANLGGRGIDGVERVALSMGLSIAIVPSVGLVLNFTPFGIRLVPVLVGVSAITVGFVALAAARRKALPEAERFRVPYEEWLEAGRAEIFEPETRLDGLLNVALACSIVLAVGVVGFAIMVPPDGESFTEFYLLGEDDDGELVIDNYPEEFVVGESQSVVVGIGNHENQPMDYTIVVQLQEVEISGNETTVVERRELDRFDSPSIADNETWQTEHDITPTMTGEDLRVQYLLYRDSVPGTPTVENAYRDNHLWVDVSEV